MQSIADFRGFYC